MDPRWKQMIVILSQAEKAISIKNLAVQLDVSEKTLKQLMQDHEANEKIYGFHFQRILGKLSLHIDDNEAFMSFPFHEQENEESNEARVNYILTRLIQENDFIRIESLAAELYVSRATIDRLMKDVKQQAQAYHLEITSRPKYGICLTGGEKDKRIAYAHFSKKTFSKEHQSLVLCVQSIVMDVVNKADIKFSDINFYNLVYHCVIAIQRIQSGKQLDVLEDYPYEHAYEKEKQAAEEIVARFEKQFQIVVPKSEVYYMMMHLLGKKMVNNQTNIKPEVWTCVDHIIDEIYQTRDLDFRNDGELRMMLALHLEPLIARMAFGLRQENELLNQIKREMHEAYELSLCAAQVIQRELSLKMEEDEAGYLALHFALAIEKKQKKQTGKKIIIVCSTGRGAAKLLQYKLVMRYHLHEEDLELKSVFELDHIREEDYCCILTTIALPKKIKLPVLLINPVLDDRTFEQIHTLLHQNQSVDTKQEILKDQLILLNQTCTNKKEVFALLEDAIRKNYDSTDEFFANIQKRESLGSTEVGNLVAMPHPYEYHENHIIIVLITLQKAITWHYEQVRLILFMALPRNQDEHIQAINDQMSELCIDVQRVGELLDTQTIEEAKRIVLG